MSEPTSCAVVPGEGVVEGEAVSVTSPLVGEGSLDLQGEGQENFVEVGVIVRVVVKAEEDVRESVEVGEREGGGVEEGGGVGYKGTLPGQLRGRAQVPPQGGSWAPWERVPR